MKPKLLSLIVAAILALSACSSPTAPVFPAGAVQIPLNDHYEEWWRELGACTGIRKPIEDVTFYQVQSLDNNAVGRWYSDGDRVYITDLFVNDEKVVKHEMMHALVQLPGHPAQYFDGACGDLGGAD